MPPGAQPGQMVKPQLAYREFTMCGLEAAMRHKECVHCSEALQPVSAWAKCGVC